MRVFFLSIVFMCFFAHPFFAYAGAKQGVKKGNLLYNKGEYEEALKEYDKASETLPDSDIINFNLGAALYKLESYQQAIGHFEKGLISKSKSLEEKANYNLGNAKYKHGINIQDENLQEAVGSLSDSLKFYERALEIEPEDSDAKNNYEFVEKELKRLEEKLEKEQKQCQLPEDQNKEDSESKESKESRKESQEQEAESQVGQENQMSAKEEDDKDEQKEALRDTESEQDLSRRQALMLLESYSQDEEPKSLYKEKIATSTLPEVLKDW